jgi:hypothetical protein
MERRQFTREFKLEAVRLDEAIASLGLTQRAAARSAGRKSWGLKCRVFGQTYAKPEIDTVSPDVSPHLVAASTIRLSAQTSRLAPS